MHTVLQSTILVNIRLVALIPAIALATGATSIYVADFNVLEASRATDSLQSGLRAGAGASRDPIRLWTAEPPPNTREAVGTGRVAARLDSHECSALSPKASFPMGRTAPRLLVATATLLRRRPAV